jgi:hypothetical protein
MKKLIAVIIMYCLECTAFGQLPTDTTMKHKQNTQKDSIRKDTAKLKGGAIIDTINRSDTINRKANQMRPKTKDDIKDTVPQHKR